MISGQHIDAPVEPSAEEYRRPMQVRESVVLKVTSEWGDKTVAYYICPRCLVSMDRDPMSYCDRCGQRLGWDKLSEVKRLYPPIRRGQTVSKH